MSITEKKNAVRMAAMGVPDPGSKKKKKADSGPRKPPKSASQEFKSEERGPPVSRNVAPLRVRLFVCLFIGPSRPQSFVAVAPALYASRVPCALSRSTTSTPSATSPQRSRHRTYRTYARMQPPEVEAKASPPKAAGSVEKGKKSTGGTLQSRKNAAKPIAAPPPEPKSDEEDTIPRIGQKKLGEKKLSIAVSEW